MNRCVISLKRINRWNHSTDPILPINVADIFKSLGGISQSAVLTLFGIHSTKYDEFLFWTFNICSSLLITLGATASGRIYSVLRLNDIDFFCLAFAFTHILCNYDLELIGYATDEKPDGETEVKSFDQIKAQQYSTQSVDRIYRLPSSSFVLIQLNSSMKSDRVWPLSEQVFTHSLPFHLLSRILYIDFEQIWLVKIQCIQPGSYHSISFIDGLCHHCWRIRKSLESIHSLYQISFNSNRWENQSSYQTNGTTECHSRSFSCL